MKRVRRTAKDYGWEREEDFAATIVAWLRDLKWEVYQEVEPLHNGSRADIVAVRGPLLWVIETKMSLGAALLYQAKMWENWAHLRSVAAPFMPSRESSYVYEMFCRDHGIGILVTRHGGYGQGDGVEVEEKIAPKLDRKAGRVSNFRDALRDEHKDFAKAGNAHQMRYTPFQATCKEVLKVVGEKPGITMKELIGAIRHHYHTPENAIAALRHWIKDGIVKGVRAEIHDRKFRVYPEEVKA